MVLWSRNLHQEKNWRKWKKYHIGMNNKENGESDAGILNLIVVFFDNKRSFNRPLDSINFPTLIFCHVSKLLWYFMITMKNSLFYVLKTAKPKYLRKHRCFYVRHFHYNHLYFVKK